MIAAVHELDETSISTIANHSTAEIDVHRLREIVADLEDRDIFDRRPDPSVYHPG